jgi:hypothetical protein
MKINKTTHEREDIVNIENQTALGNSYKTYGSIN